MIVDGGDDRRNQNPHRHAGFGQLRTVRNLAAGVLARGSMTRERSGSSVVMLTFTRINRSTAIGARMSKSRATNAFFVMMLMG